MNTTKVRIKNSSRKKNDKFFFSNSVARERGQGAYTSKTLIWMKEKKEVEGVAQ